MMEKIKQFWSSNKGFIVFIFLMVFFRSAVADWYHVPTGSMQPNILIGDRVWVDKLAYDVKVPLTGINLYRHNEPRHGEVVVFNSEVSKNRLIKRVIGVPGDTLEMKGNQLYINGLALQLEPLLESQSFDLFLNDRDIATYWQELTINANNEQVIHTIRVTLEGQSFLSSFSPITVPRDYLWVMGDNRDNSSDSRVIGLVPRSELVGQAKKVVVSFDPDNYYLPRSGRFLSEL